MKYKVNDGMQITIRKASIVQSMDEITRLSSGTIFEADTVSQTDNTHWVRVTKCDTNTKAMGYFGAVMYPNILGIGKVFATEIITDPEPPAPVFPTSFILENPADGSRAEYVFVRIL